MAKLGDLIVRVGADTRDLNKKLGRVQRNMRSMTGNMEKLGRSITQSVTLPLAGMAALSVQAFRDQAKAVAQVEQGLKSTGNAAGRTLGDLTKMASELQKNTLFGDEDILQNATAQLLTFTNIAGDEFDRTQKAALDLATRLGGDLKSASIQLGKALNDPIANLSGLSRSGIQFSKEQKEVIKSLAETGELAKAQGIILDELEKQYGGSAEAAAKADGGITQLGNAIGDLGEEIGRIVTGMIGPMVKRIREMVEGFTNLDESTKRVIVRLGGIVAAFGPMLFFLPQIITQIKLLSVALASNPIFAAAGVITAIGFALSDMAVNAKKATTSIQELREQFNELDEASRKQKRAETADTIELLFAYRDLQEGIQAAQDQATKGLGAGSFPAINASIAATKDFIANLSNAEKAVLDQGDALLNVNRENIVYAAQVDTATDAIFEQQNKLAALTTQVVKSKQSIKDAAEANTDLAKTAKDAEEDVFDLLSRLDEVAVKGVEAKQSIFDLLSELDEISVPPAMAEINKELQALITSFTDGIQTAIQQTMSFGDAVVMVAKQVVVAFLTAAKAKVIQNAAEGSAGSGPAFPIVMAGLLAAGIGVVNSIALPALAKGGMAFGPTMALIGDNRNAAIDPEVVAPLSKLRDMMGGNQVEVFGRISGNDIFLSNARTGTSRNRYA